ncbi:MAG TPA: tetratricopeptide repeat protein, partial [Polyangiaceae bacterium]
MAGARAAATEGAKAFQEGRWQDAVDLFTRAESLVHAPPHLLFLARAQVKLGRLVAARELYNKILREPLAGDAPPAFLTAREAAEAEIET